MTREEMRLREFISLHQGDRYRGAGPQEKE